MTKIRLSLILTTLIAFSGTVIGQEARTISLRTLCFQHVDNIREVFLLTGNPKSPDLIPLKLYTSTYSDAVEATVTGSTLQFALKMDPVAGDPKALPYRIIAQSKIASGARQVALFLPSNKENSPYTVRTIDESEKVFPMGSTLVYNLTSTETRITIGEHGKEIKPGGSALLPLATKVNDLNQTTVRVYLKTGAEDWKTVSSTVWRASKELRNLALAYIHPRTKKPTVNCFQETPPWRLPQLGE